jgi:hypothetical protein
MSILNCRRFGQLAPNWINPTPHLLTPLIPCPIATDLRHDIYPSGASWSNHPPNICYGAAVVNGSPTCCPPVPSELDMLYHCGLRIHRSSNPLLCVFFLSFFQLGTVEMPKICAIPTHRNPTDNEVSSKPWCTMAFPRIDSRPCTARELKLSPTASRSCELNSGTQHRASSHVHLISYAAVQAARETLPFSHCPHHALQVRSPRRRHSAQDVDNVRCLYCYLAFHGSSIRQIVSRRADSF